MSNTSLNPTLPRQTSFRDKKAVPALSGVGGKAEIHTWALSISGPPGKKENHQSAHMCPTLGYVFMKQEAGLPQTVVLPWEDPSPTSTWLPQAIGTCIRKQLSETCGFGVRCRTRPASCPKFPTFPRSPRRKEWRCQRGPDSEMTTISLLTSSRGVESSFLAAHGPTPTTTSLVQATVSSRWWPAGS